MDDGAGAGAGDEGVGAGAGLLAGAGLEGAGAGLEAGGAAEEGLDGGGAREDGSAAVEGAAEGVTAVGEEGDGDARVDKSVRKDVRAVALVDILTTIGSQKGCNAEAGDAQRQRDCPGEKCSRVRAFGLRQDETGRKVKMELPRRRQFSVAECRKTDQRLMVGSVARAQW